jgi:hypothetical protein
MPADGFFDLDGWMALVLVELTAARRKPQRELDEMMIFAGPALNEMSRVFYGR